MFDTFKEYLPSEILERIMVPVENYEPFYFVEDEDEDSDPNYL